MEEDLFGPVPVPEALAAAARRRGWPDGLLQRALNARVPRYELDWWLNERDAPPVGRIERLVDAREQVVFGTLRVRAATDADEAALCDFFAHAPEQIGEWEVNLERSPRPFAQFGLQEDPVLNLVEDRGVVVATCAWSRRNTLVGGRRMHIHFGSALRVRAGFRGKGYADLVRMAPRWWGPWTSAQYFYMRSQNVTAASYFNSVAGSLLAGAPKREGDVPGNPVTVLAYPRRPFEGDATGIRTVRRADLRRCVSLINRTHGGLDLFRPYTVEYLQDRLDEHTWEEKTPEWLATFSVYGWRDYYVLEEEARVVACAGLWDRGKDLREVWRHTPTGEPRTITSAAVLDFGFAEGHERAMARLLAYFIGETDRLGRDHLLVPLEHLPDVAALLERYEPVAETRGLPWTVFGPEGPMAHPDPPMGRPYTDLSYW